MAEKGWYTRGYLPHYDKSALIQGITYRLWDALPRHVVESLLVESDANKDAANRAKLEEYLNAGYGACYLRNPRIARIVEEAFFQFDGERYDLIAWVVMPNHVHVMIRQFDGYSLDRIMHSWKSYTATQANLILQRRGRFWFADYFDRYIRNERHFAAAVRYIHENPVVAGLVDTAVEWEFSSARRWSDCC